MVNLDCIGGNTQYPIIRIQAYITEYYIEKDGAALILKWKAPCRYVVLQNCRLKDNYLLSLDYVQLYWSINMFFLCFSGQDRMTIVRSVLYHLEKYGIITWYDNHEYVLGDNKKENYTQAIYNSQYAIVIISRTFSESLGAIEELDIIKQRYESGYLHVFPIFYNILANDVPEQYQWLCDLIYNELNDSTGSLLTCNQIVCKYYSDLLSNCQFHSINDLLQYTYEMPSYIVKMIENYNEIIPSNTNSRIAFLYSIYLFFEQNTGLPCYLTKSAHYIFQNTKLDLGYDFKEITLMEEIVCLSANHYIKNNP